MPEPLNNLNIDFTKEGYLNGSQYDVRKQFIPSIIDYFVYQGPSNFKLNFWVPLSPENKEQFIHDIFLHLIACPSSEKMNILDLLEILYLDTSSTKNDLREKLLYIFYAALFEKRNYKLALVGLNFFIHLWKNSNEDDPVRDEIFPKLLDFIDTEDEISAQEGIFEIIKILDYTSGRQRERFFENLLFLAEKRKNPEIQYAILEAINEIIVKYLYDLQSFPSSILTVRILKLLENKKIRHWKPIFSLLRLIFGNKFSLTDSAEKNILKLLDKAYHQLSFENQMEFFQALFDFLQNAGFHSKQEILKPYIKKIQILFKARSEIAPEIALVIENIVNWMWEMGVLSEKDQDNFYS